jgi:hypothetical protein
MLPFENCDNRSYCRGFSVLGSENCCLMSVGVGILQDEAAQRT